MSYSQSDQPGQNPSEPIHPEKCAEPERQSTPREPEVVAHIPPAPADTGQTDQSRSDHAPTWRKVAEIGAVLIALALLVVNVFMLRPAYIAARAATASADGAIEAVRLSQEALAQARDNARQDQRPYLWLTNNLGSPIFIPSRVGETTLPVGQVAWTWRFTNYGKSSAYTVQFEEYIKVGDRAFTKSYGVKGQSVGPPMPPAKENFGTIVSPPGISQEEIQRLLTTDLSIRIRVNMSYTDSYGTKYATDFCLARLATGAILYCVSGNDMK